MKSTSILSILLLTLSFTSIAWSSPDEDIKTYRTFFTKKFPQLSLQDFANGLYAIDPISRETWEAIEEFPPYEIAIDDGEVLFNTPFRNGKTYASCFDKNGYGIAHTYPRWDKKIGKVITLALAINECREKNGETALPYNKGDIASILSFMASTSRGKKINISVPADDKNALLAYQDGKIFYFQRRGQLNFSCSHCHMMYSGSKLRSEILSPALGHGTGWPTYRAKWDEVGTLHRRFQGCNKQVGAKPFKPQSEAYRNLEYFLTHMSNGLEFNGPSSRR